MFDSAVLDPRRPSSRRFSRQRLSSQRGSVLVTVSVVLFLLSVVFAYAVPVYQRHRRESLARATLLDLQRFQAAFQDYASRNGDWPATSDGAGKIPSGMEAALRDSDWTERTPIGGHFIWLTKTLERGERVQAAIAIVTTADDQVSDDIRQLGELTQHAAEARLDPHRLRFGFRNEPVYVLEH